MKHFILTIILILSMGLIIVEADYTLKLTQQKRVTGYAQYIHKINIKQVVD